MSRKIMYSLYAQSFIDEAFAKFERGRLDAAIDEALILGDREAFIELTKRRKAMIEGASYLVR